MPPSRSVPDTFSPRPPGRWRYVWGLALVVATGCQTIGLPERWSVSHAPTASEKDVETSEATIAAAEAKADDAAPELVSRLRPLLADGGWALDPAWSLLECTSDPTRFGPAFDPGFRWRFVPATPVVEPEVPSLIEQERRSRPAQSASEWDWLFRGGNPPAGEAAAGQVVPALQHLAKEGSPAGINASILLWRRFPAQGTDRGDLRELLASTPPTAQQAKSDFLKTLSRQAGAGRGLVPLAGDASWRSEVALAPAGRLLERADLTEEAAAASGGAWPCGSLLLKFRGLPRPWKRKLATPTAVFGSPRSKPV